MVLRNVVAAALGAMLAGGALAQQAPAEPPKPAEAPKLPFTIYASLNVNFQLTQAQGATASGASVKSRFAVSTDSSNLGVRGSLPVRDWFQVVYQCETSANVDGISVSGICNRNSRLGLSSDRFGTLFYGNWDTPYKAMAYTTKADDPFLNTDVYGFDGMMSSPGFNYRSGGWATASNTSTIGFDVRASNSVGYHSPKWSGLAFKLQYSANEFKNASGTQDPTLYSAVVNYDQGPLSVAAAYEYHRDGFALAGISNTTTGGPGLAFGATTANSAGSATAADHSADSAWRLAAGYQLGWAAGDTTIGAMLEQLRLEQKDAPAGAVKSYQRAGWQVALKHRTGPHELRARFNMNDRGSCSLAGGGDCSTSGYGATEIALGYAYYFTGTAQVYLHFARIQNDRNAQYTFPIGGSPAVAGATPKGADPQAVGLGVRYTF